MYVRVCVCVCVCVCIHALLGKFSRTWQSQSRWDFLIVPQTWLAQSAGAVEYTDCFSAEG